MQSDEIVWQVINHGHCSYKAKTIRQNFCRNEHNITGLCNRSSCPLANSRYATIREDRGRLYLCIKTIERAHTPNKLWQKIRLSPTYMKALEQINEHLAHWPKFLVHKNKQRLTKITQYLIRMRKLALKPKVSIIPQPTKLKQLHVRKERKALRAAQLDKAIERELLERLHAGTYGDIYNFPSLQYNRALDKEAVGDREEVERDVEEGVKASELGIREGRGPKRREENDSGEEEDVEGEVEEEMELDYESDDEDIQYAEDLEESDEDIEDLGIRWEASESSEEDDGDEEGASDDDDDEGGGPSGGRSHRKDSRNTRRSAQAAATRQKRGRELEMEEERELATHARRVA